MWWKRSAVLQILEISRMSVDVVRRSHVHAGGHRHRTLARRRGGQGRAMTGQVVPLRACSRCLVGFGCCQGCRSGRCCFLNRAAVVILMSSQGSSACKCLLAIGIGTFIRPVAGVSTSVASERAAIAKALFDTWLA